MGVDMISTNGMIIAFSAAAFMLFVLVGVRGASRLTEEDYLIGGRNVGSMLLAGTIAAGVIGGGVILVFFEYAFRYGLAAFAIIGGVSLGLIALNFVALRYKPLADQQAFYTLPDLYRYFWGPRAGLLASVVILLWTGGFIVMQLIGAGTIVAVMTDWPYSYGVIAAAVTVASYLLASGYKAVIATDVLQYVVLILLLVVVAAFAVPQIADPTVMFAFDERMDIGVAGAFFILGALNIIVSADLWQRIYSARSPQAARNGLLVGAALVLLAGALLFIPPIFARLYLPTAAPNHAAIESLSLILPSWLLGFGLVGILSTVIAALDTMVFVLAISTVHDIRVREIGDPADRRRRNMRITMALILVGGSLLAIWSPDLLNTALALSSLGLILAPSILLQLTRWPPPSAGVQLSIALGLASLAFLFATSALSPETAVLSGIASMIGIAIGYIVNRISTKSNS
jgi:SSS family solute:Na+ symporter